MVANKPKLTYTDLERDENGKYVIHLESSEVLDAGERTKTLRLDEPKVRHLKAMDKVQGENQKMIKFLSDLSGIPVSSFEEISLRDLNTNIGPVLEVLMGESQETGETP